MSKAHVGKRRRSRPIGHTRRAQSEEAHSLEAQVVTLATSGKLTAAAEDAVRAQLELGLAVVFQEGDRIVRLFPDGRQETVKTLRRRPYKVPADVPRL